MPLLNASIDILLYTLIAIGVPLIVRTISLQKPQPTSRPFLRTPLSILVVLHTLFTLYTLVWHQPPNLFTALDIPITTPAQRIRSAIFEHTARDPRFIISPSHDALLARLSSFEVRTFLVRFGQQAVESCEYCQSLNDFAIHSIPRPLLEYVREAFLIGLVTTHGSARERRRMFAVALLACAAAGEAYWLYTAPVVLRIGNIIQEVPMWHDLLWTVRHILFLGILPTLHLLPPLPASPRVCAALAFASPIVDSTLARAQLLRYSRGAILRDPRPARARGCILGRR